jgi:hypothetical protein
LNVAIDWASPRRLDVRLETANTVIKSKYFFMRGV